VHLLLVLNKTGTIATGPSLPPIPTTLINQQHQPGLHQQPQTPVLPSGFIQQIQHSMTLSQSQSQAHQPTILQSQMLHIT